jgi:hypothetical protein
MAGASESDIAKAECWRAVDASRRSALILDIRACQYSKLYIVRNALAEREMFNGYFEQIFTYI